MSLQLRYNRVTTAGGVDPDHITARQGVTFTSNAEEGSVGTSQIVVDDTSNALDYVGLRRVYAFETRAQAHNQIVYNGYLADRTIGRQPAEGQDSDEEVLGRRWSLAVTDTNSLLSRRLITGADGNRPAETDIARIQWLLDSNDAYLSNPHDNWENPSPYIDTSSPVSMDAADLRGQTAFDVLNDCAQRSGKNWFAQYYEANDTVPPTNAGSYALHYYTAESSFNSSTLRLSNVNGDADNVTTFAVLPDALLTRDPRRSYSGVLVQYDGGETYVQSTNVANLFQRRDAAISNPNVKTAAKAIALGNRYLADAATEDDRITCKFVVPAANVNDLREGQRCQAKFSHFDDYTAYSYMRCLRRTVKQMGDDEYEISVELSPAPGSVSIAQTYSYRSGDGPGENSIFASPVTPGNLLVLAVARRAGALGFSIKLNDSVGDLRSFTPFATDVSDGFNPCGLWYRVATGDEQNLYFEGTKLQWTIWEVSGAGDPTGFDVLRLTGQSSAATKTLGTLASSTLQLAGYVVNNDNTGSLDQTVGTGWTQDQQRKDLTTNGAPVTVQMHATSNPTVEVGGGAYTWGALAVGITT